MNPKAPTYDGDGREYVYPTLDELEAAAAKAAEEAAAAKAAEEAAAAKAAEEAAAAKAAEAVLAPTGLNEPAAAESTVSASESAQ